MTAELVEDWIPVTTVTKPDRVDGVRSTDVENPGSSSMSANDRYVVIASDLQTILSSLPALKTGNIYLLQVDTHQSTCRDAWPNSDPILSLQLKYELGSVDECGNTVLNEDGYATRGHIFIEDTEYPMCSVSADTCHKFSTALNHVTGRALVFERFEAELSEERRKGLRYPASINTVVKLPMGVILGCASY